MPTSAGGLAPERSEIRVIAVHPNHDATLYVRIQVGPYRTMDGGETWTSMNLPVEQVTWSILIHPNDPNAVLCGTVDNGVFRSDDGGSSWRKLDYQLPASVCTMGLPTRVVRLAMDPSNPDDIYAALEVGGLVRSLDAERLGWTATLGFWPIPSRIGTRVELVAIRTLKACLILMRLPFHLPRPVNFSWPIEWGCSPALIEVNHGLT